jgi:hypothetical protein
MHESVQSLVVFSYLWAPHSYQFKLKKKNQQIELPVVAVWINDVLLTKMQLVKFVKTKSGFR